jgi:hypothetical protein
MLIQDNGYYSNIENHDVLMSMSAMWVDHYNFLLNLSWNTDVDNAIYEEEMREHLCYDV